VGGIIVSTGLRGTAPKSARASGTFGSVRCANQRVSLETRSILVETKDLVGAYQPDKEVFWDEVSECIEL
jgi:hypothetical protein